MTQGGTEGWYRKDYIMKHTLATYYKLASNLSNALKTDVINSLHLPILGRYFGLIFYNKGTPWKRGRGWEAPRTVHVCEGQCPMTQLKEVCRAHESG